jgi:dipeptidyl-peptidase-4
MKSLFCLAAAIGTLSSCGAPGELTPAAVGPVPQGREPVPVVVNRPDSGGHAPIAGAEASRISFERMARFPEPGWHTPRAIAYSPDGKLVTYLASESQNEEMTLFAFDVALKRTRILLRAGDLVKNAGPIPGEEELRRERQRKRIQGVTGYEWAKRVEAMVIPHLGDVFVRGKDGTIERLTETDEPEVDPKICDTGERVAFVRKGELVVVEMSTRREKLLTKNAPAGVTRGLSDFNAQEEFREPSGFFWSPGCDRIAYVEVDEQKVQPVPVLGYRGGKADLMMQRYPVAGQANPSVKVAVAGVQSGKTVWLKWPDETESYFGRFAWAPDGKALYLQRLSRDQRRLSLVRADPASGAITELVAETSKDWMEFQEFRPLERTPRFLRTGVAEGHAHLEIREAETGKIIRRLTAGDWDVQSIAGIDEENEHIFWTGTKDGPLERHLYRVSFGGGEIRRLTVEPGVHDVVMAPKGAGHAGVHSAANRLPRAGVYGAGGALAGELPLSRDADLGELSLRVPEILTVKASNGDTLYGALLMPRVMEAGRRYPVVLMVYGGPGAQTVQNKWSPRLLWQHLADRGFIVFQLDNRGSAGRGHAFQSAIHERLGEVELTDQLAGLDALAKRPSVDAGRIAIYGHSYGGFMAALAMLRAPDRFRAGIAGSPVVDWALYDSGYTERFMNSPAKNPAGYDAANLAKLAPNLRGNLFLIHALMDENVHFQNTALLIDALIAANKPFDLLVFPGERHGYRSPAARQYAHRRIVDFLVEHLR